jgi:bacillithiol system protein YtxJ
MSPSRLDLVPDPASALDSIRAASKQGPVVVFKHSPICPTSRWAESELETWLGALSEGHPLTVARIDVIAQRELARGLSRALGIRHESPQALWFSGGEMTWSGSHSDLTGERYAALYAEAE